jgi:paraquat-inducible protein B
MNSKANPQLVGAFVLGAVALLVGAVVAFGASGGLFKKTATMVTFFEGSVNNLNVGSPVTFRGVRMGAVSRIEMLFNTRTLSTQIPVFLELESERITLTDQSEQLQDIEGYKRMLARGFSAQLVPQSLVTGQLMVELDFRPGMPTTLVGRDMGVLEIPSVKSDIDVLREAVANLPLAALSEAALSALKKLDAQLGSPDLPIAVAALAGGLRNIEALTASANAEVGPIASAVMETLAQTRETLKTTQDEVQTTLAELRAVAGSAQADVKALVGPLTGAARVAERSLQQLNSVVTTAEGMIARDSPLRYELETTMRNLSTAARALRSFADQIDRNPNALIIGRQNR